MNSYRWIRASVCACAISVCAGQAASGQVLIADYAGFVTNSFGGNQPATWQTFFTAPDQVSVDFMIFGFAGGVFQDPLFHLFGTLAPDGSIDATFDQAITGFLGTTNSHVHWTLQPNGDTTLFVDMFDNPPPSFSSMTIEGNIGPLKDIIDGIVPAPDPVTFTWQLGDGLLDPGGTGEQVLFATGDITLNLVPEPAAAALLAIGGLALVRRRA